ncbi:MAG: cytochrome c3 family protein [Chloroflexi bacterium]|nr:cytochrome c3 family protein [Chloroflexota bacterium]
MKEWLIFVAGLAVLGLAALGLTANVENRATVTQPIAFNHQKHSPFLTCTSCHTTVATSARAGIPGKDFCFSCHQNKVTDNPEPEKIRNYVEKRQEIPWVRLFRLNDDIVYTHEPHISAGIQCQSCHGDIGSSAAGVTGFGRKGSGGQYGRDLMDACLKCHEQRKASTDCYTCHQ